jgi:hypothetical protein
MGGTAKQVQDADEYRKVGQLLYEKFPQVNDFAKTETQEVVFFRIEPSVISYMDYAKGIGHTELYEV